VTLRCNNREFLFEEPWFTQFIRLVQDARAKFPIRLYHYCLMTNHVHLLFRVGCDDTLPKMMHWLSTTFVRHFSYRAWRPTRCPFVAMDRARFDAARCNRLL